MSIENLIANVPNLRTQIAVDMAKELIRLEENKTFTQGHYGRESLARIAVSLADEILEELNRTAESKEEAKEHE